MIHANICDSRKLSTISLAAETLYYRLLTRVDDDGNFTAEARIVLGQCAPMRKEWNEEVVAGLLEELATVADTDKKPLIQFYVKGTDKFLHISRFEEFQYLRPDRAAYVKWPTHPPRMGTSLVAKRSTAGIPTAGQSKDKIREVNPNQKELELDGDIMAKRDRIASIAGKQKLGKEEGKGIDFLITQYAKEVPETVVTDFEQWFAAEGSGYEYPVSAYIKIAPSRLQAGAERGIIKSDGRINEIVAFVYTMSQQAPRSADVAALLAENAQDEIQDAFKEYADGLDDFGLKNSARAFFKDGAGTGIILARRQKKAAEAKQKAEIATSTEVGIAQRRATQEELAKRIQAEKDLADKLGDNPF